MTNTDVVGQILSLTGDFLTYMLPVIGVLAGIKLIFSLFFHAIGFGKRNIWG